MKPLNKLLPHLAAISLFMLLLAISIFGSDREAGAQELPELEITQLNDNLFLHTSYEYFDGFGLVDSNGLVYVDDQSAYVIDTPASEADTQKLVEAFRERGFTINGSISTHFHDDSAIGIAWLNSQSIPTYAYHMTNDLLTNAGMAQASHTIASINHWLFNGKVEVFYPGGGHSPDNVVVWLPEEGVLFGGCFVKTGSLGNLSDADLDAWPDSARSLLARYGDAETVVPGHGEVSDVALLESTLALTLEWHAAQ